MEQIGLLFETYYWQFVSIAKWFFIIKGAADLVKKMNDGFDASSSFKIVFNYGAGYASLYALVKVLDEVERMLPK